MKCQTCVLVEQIRITVIDPSESQAWVWVNGRGASNLNDGVDLMTWLMPDLAFCARELVGTLS